MRVLHLLAACGGAGALKHQQMPDFDEVDIVCHDQWPVSCDVPVPRLDREQTTELMRKVRKSCIGEGWSEDECHLNLHWFRAGTLGPLQNFVGGPNRQAFPGTSARCRAAPVKKFRKGGGVKAAIPCRRGGHDAHLYYRHIYKDAGLAIKKNLFKIAGLPYDAAVDQDWEGNHRCAELNFERQRFTSSIFGVTDVAKPVLFTFVRDPIEKFIAGYKEMCTRHLIDNLRGHPVGTLEHAKAFLDFVMQGTCDNGHVLIQAQSLLGKRCESKFDYIGKLEHFEDDWQRLSETAQCDTDIGWPMQPKHESQKEDDGSDAAIRQALDEHDGDRKSVV